MRVYGTLIFIGCVATALAYTSCTKQSDCEEDECCLDNLFFKRPWCTPRYAAGSRCPTASIYKEETDLFYFSCPCVKMYECLGKGTTEDGVTVVRDAKCIMPTI
ncbi:toxin CSTX-20-like [Parasteatoda tepidariorum]|uniref:toxin CSTX-20-like n=1 Tax=Parasteatoda tepidariorum TaxID=114398 RepID=UPI00077FD2BB|nr:toxin CSTX-20-like [Parasteatoda tepidariorum]